MPGDPRKTYEIRCPIYGFVSLSEWERDIISQPAFQRLRRIRQLAWTDYVYPGAMHTRFEHVLGVMHMATMLYDGIVQRSRDILIHEMGYDEAGLHRHRVLVRLAALLHDVGHSPFSHAAEELFPVNPDGQSGERYQHEEYSAAIIRSKLSDVIRHHPANRNYDFTADHVAQLLEGAPEAGHALFWRELISGQMDADRMDYLLRDSHHAGVSYGRYDWRRLVHTVQVVPGPNGGSPRLGIAEGGWHAAESLILARYFMFTQVYFHKTRVAMDHHLQNALAAMLPGGEFPAPLEEQINAYLEWDDWRVLGLLAAGQGGEHGHRLAARNHYREIVHTPETPSPEDEQQLKRWREVLGDLLAAEVPAEKSWYKVGPADILVLSETPENSIRPLSAYSSAVASIKPARQVLLFARPEHRDDARAKIGSLQQG